MKKYTELKTQRHNLCDVVPLAKPYTVLIEPSNYCNFRCVSCFQSLKSDNYITKKRGLMSLERFSKIIEQLKNWKGEKIKVLKLSLYGEPFTNSDFCQMLRIAKEADIAERIETTTNASLITPEIARQLVECGIDYIRVSIYGASQERYQKVTGTKSADINAIYRSLELIQYYKKEMKCEKPFVGVKMLDTFSEENQAFIEFFSPVADETYIDKPHNWVATEEKSFVDSLYNTSEKKEQLIKNQKSSYHERKCCPMAFTTIAVRSDGMVSPCCIDWQGNTNIGNIDDMSLAEIWNGVSMYNFQKMQLEFRNHENISCRNCEFYKSDYYMLDDLDGFPVEKLRKPE